MTEVRDGATNAQYMKKRLAVVRLNMMQTINNSVESGQNNVMIYKLTEPQSQRCLTAITIRIIKQYFRQRFQQPSSNFSHK